MLSRDRASREGSCFPACVAGEDRAGEDRDEERPLDKRERKTGKKFCLIGICVQKRDMVITTVAYRKLI